MTEIVVRPYEPTDRAGVRHVCYETGYMGSPATWMWRDVESFADLFSGYYTDREPESALVAERDGAVVGYLLGCKDTRRAGNPGKQLTRHIVRRGILFRPGTAGFFWRSGRDLAVDALHRQAPPGPVIDERWPAHLHINLLPVARGQGVGATLVHRWLDTLRGEHIGGCHLETLAENTNAITFFQSVGFRREHEPHLIPGMRTPNGARHHIQLMVQPL